MAGLTLDISMSLDGFIAGPNAGGASPSVTHLRFAVATGAPTP